MGPSLPRQNFFRRVEFVIMLLVRIFRGGCRGREACRMKTLVESAHSGVAAPLAPRAQLPALARAYSSKTEVRAQASRAQAQIQPEVDDAVPAFVNAESPVMAWNEWDPLEEIIVGPNASSLTPTKPPFIRCLKAWELNASKFRFV